MELAEHLSAAEIIDSDSESPDAQNDANEYMSSYRCSCNANIYNAFLIANYRQDLRFKDHDFITRDIKYGLGFLAYSTATIQWIALCIMIAAFIDKSDHPLDKNSLKQWTFFPSSWHSLLLWPFFMIGLLSTYKQLAQIWVDIYILADWNINRTLCHVLFLKYFSELILYTVGSFVYYITLSWYSRDVAYLDVILKLLAYQYIFMADECAYMLVKDIVSRRLRAEHRHSFFQGTRKGKITRYELMICIAIPMSVSFMVQGIFSRAWFTFILGILSTCLWSFDYLAAKCTKNQ